MHLRRLVVKGFKSFADRTVIDFSPGISVVVGPNGSGKSNVVDAIAWVLGERGARALRGGTMEDVIFAGTPQRAGLGRAEVELTIDNSDGALAIDLAEVTIRRTLFRTGESDYAINGTSCRLLDITELLSDSGIGRELHTLVGQGHLDDILAGTPADRRAIIEDAAGLLKHRKRKEKALRKLERVDSDLERLGDLVGELKRQIRPLERQAELAKRADSIAAELAEARLRLWVLDHREISQEDDATSVAHALAEVQRLAIESKDVVERLAATEQALELAQKDAESLLSLELRLQGMLERFKSLAGLAAERARRLADRAARAPSDDIPDERTIAVAHEAAEAVAFAAEEAAEVHAALVVDRDAARTESMRIARAIQEVKRLEAEREARRANKARLADEIAAIEPLRQRAATDLEVAEHEGMQARDRLTALEKRETGLAGRSDELDALLSEAKEAVSTAETAEREAERNLAALEARREVLAEEMERQRDPAAFVSHMSGIGGRVLDSLEVEPGYEAAVLAALGALTEAVLVNSIEEAAGAIEAWREAGLRGLLVVSEGLSATPALPMGSVAEHVKARSQDGVRLAAHLATVALAADIADAADILKADPGRIVVTQDGDRIESGLISGGATATVRDLAGDMRRLDEELQRLGAVRDGLSAETIACRTAASEAAADVAVADEQLNAIDAESEALHAQLDRANRTADAARVEVARLLKRSEDLVAQAAKEDALLSDLDASLEGAEILAGPADEELVRLETEVAEAARVLGELTERRRAAEAHHRKLAERAVRVTKEIRQYELGRDAWERGSVRCSQIASEAEATVHAILRWVEEATEARSGGEVRRATLSQDLASLRSRRREIDTVLDETRERAHVAELREADRRHRLEALEAACRERLKMEPSEALEAVDPDPQDREALEQQARGLERKLGLLGRVNPIAMEQHEELIERHRFLSDQVEDLRTARRDLVGVVTEVDKTITEIFAAAFTDIAREFEATFERVFPGGEGRLTLVDPENLLETGIEVEARPAGKRVKRVSLLSGGERSLVALALLFAVFKARPSPFYILDEVEAALDDVNLDRVLKVLSDFRESAQLLIVTHQKRTMEIADVIYGIAMAEAGVTRVLSERLDHVVEPV